VANSVTLYDVNADKTRAEVLDLNQGIQFVPMASVTGSDIVVVTAGAKQRPGQTRLELAGINVELCRKLVPQLVELSPNALLLLVTNPVDVLTYAATKFSGLPHHRVVGSGTVLDSSRLRVLLPTLLAWYGDGGDVAARPLLRTSGTSTPSSSTGTRRAH